MERILRIFNKEFSKISEAALVLGAFTFLSQILAIFRDRLFAGQIGTGQILDVYYAAFRVPDLLFSLGASLVSVSILMPFFTSELHKSQENGKKFINDVFTSFFIFIVVASLILLLLMPAIAKRLFVGFEPHALQQTIMLSRVMLLSPILLGLSNLFATITQAFKKFFVYALAPVFYNLGIILGIIWFYPIFGSIGLAYGVAVGALFHMLIQIPVVIRQGFFPRLSMNIDWRHIGTVLKHSLPRTITLSMSKIVFLVFVSLASTLVAGTISVFNLSYNLQSVPLAIIGVSYSVAAFPILVEFFNGKETEQFMRHVMVPIRQIVFWSLPVIALFVVLRAQIVRVILGTGNFDWSDTRLTAASLALFIISVVAQSIVLLLIRAYYASGRTWKPLWITFGSSLVTIAIAFVFVRVFNENQMVQDFFETMLRIKHVPGSNVIMLSLAYSVGMFLNLGLLWHAFKRDFSYEPRYYIARTFWQSFIASLLMGAIAYVSLRIFDPYFSQETVTGVLSQGLISGIIAILAGSVFLLSIKNREAMMFAQTLKRKFWKSEVLIEGNVDVS